MKSDIIKKLLSLKKKLNLKEDAKVLEEAVETIQSLQEEKEDVWFLLEEIKKSDINNYKKQIESTIAIKTLAQMARYRTKLNEKN